MEKIFVSKCCGFNYETISADEGTAYMECTHCKKPCDIKTWYRGTYKVSYMAAE